MRFIQSILAGAALVAAAFAVEINEFPSEVQPGKSYVIKYTPGDNTPTTFILRKGSNDNLDTIATLTTSATGGSFTWNVDSALPNADDYALQVKQGGEDNYIGPIKLTGSSASVSPSASASASASESSAASSAATTETPSTITSASASASASLSTPGSNSTVSTATLSRSATPSARPSGSSSGSPTNSAGAPQNTNAASTLASSPLALIFGAVAAMAYLN